MSDSQTWTEEAEELYLKEGDSTGCQVSRLFFERSKDNVIVHRRLAVFCTAVAPVKSYLEGLDQSADWSWLSNFLEELRTVEHNLDGKPREQALKAVTSEATGEILRRSRMSSPPGGLR